MSPGPAGYRLFVDAPAAWKRMTMDWKAQRPGQVFSPLPAAYRRERKATPEEHAELTRSVGEED